MHGQPHETITTSKRKKNRSIDETFSYPVNHKEVAMKRLITLISACLFASTQLLAGERPNNELSAQAKLERIEKNLINAFESDVPGLQSSAALTLRQLREVAPHYDWDRSIVPLMHIVNREEHDACARIAAAMVLHELRSSRGDWAIERTAQFADNPRVKRYCTILHKSRILERSERSTP
jgi:hypothetical protein